MARRRISPEQGLQALRSWLAGDAAATTVAVRFTLEELGERAPGASVEVRVPPAGVVQAIEGPRHTRGTPPNTVEMTPQVWLDLVFGRLTWDEARASGQVQASGLRADLAELLPLYDPGAIQG